LWVQVGRGTASHPKGALSRTVLALVPEKISNSPSALNSVSPTLVDGGGEPTLTDWPLCVAFATRTFDAVTTASLGFGHPHQFGTSAPRKLSHRVDRVAPVKTVVLGDTPPALTSLIAERQRLGLDTHDEVWNGEYHMAPAASFSHGEIEMALGRLLHTKASPLSMTVTGAFNLGTNDDFRVPDLGVHRQRGSVWMTTAAIVVEVRSPHDETYEKVAFYFEHDVQELLIADLTTKTVTWFVRGDREFVVAEKSILVGLSSDDVAHELGW
jgi:Uma2 family endonuclease